MHEHKSDCDAPHEALRHKQPTQSRPSPPRPGRTGGSAPVCVVAHRSAAYCHRPKIRRIGLERVGSGSAAPQGRKTGAGDCFCTTVVADGRSNATRPLSEPDIRSAAPLSVCFGALWALRARPSQSPPPQPARTAAACWRSPWWIAPSRAAQHRKQDHASCPPTHALPTSLSRSAPAPAPAPRAAGAAGAAVHAPPARPMQRVTCAPPGES